jgi:hypothetical protein
LLLEIFDLTCLACQFLLADGHDYLSIVVENKEVKALIHVGHDDQGLAFRLDVTHIAIDSKSCRLRHQTLKPAQ